MLSDSAGLLYSGSGSRESFFVLHVSKYAGKTLDVHDDSSFRKEYEHEPDPEWICAEFVLVPFAGYGVG